ncbi:RagB/SusD family nutrient uptake outer membrane protein [Pseudoflavitalea sp. G-6-1-2]|uniref:RagB/SusD family nutrient uptake outer membrane protein n=1 Tax=Pseudoflavitalea sp. G-6-1-2 TaxID=2728841 RepID=UPI00146EF5BA|nr:RagB/SusD family nutrient uptake outer membrane protein [Pseudoflavitalea sp. G-6-1-2]NML20714.1 RagB/SusD family nutrient uptake outer membrane protein [Pseudoflavitalea sp. G-6-1-2]
MNRIIYLFILSGLLLAGCEKNFLEVEQPGVITVSTTKDYDMMLNSSAVTSFISWPMLCLNDNFEFPSSKAPAGAPGMVYTWQNQPYQQEDPALWSQPYKAIYYANLVINEVENSTGGLATEKTKLKGEGLLTRGYMHFLLLQLYAKHYDAATAATDYGIPYVTTTDMYGVTPARSTVADCYTKVLNDIEQAIPLLPKTSTLSIRGSKAAAHATLSRIYLHMKNYEKAIANADAALALKSDLLDYSPATFRAVAFPANPEFYYLKTVTEFEHPYSANLTADAKALFNTTDSRKRLFVNALGYAAFSSHYGITVPEVMLIKAEALARKSSPDLTAALDIMNRLNKNRDRSHTDLSSTDAEQVITWILNEKRRELLPSPLRWFDMRRLAPEGRTPTVTRTVGTTTYTLEPNSKKYTMMIPAVVIRFNPDMPQNER